MAERDEIDSPWKEAVELYFQPFMALLFPESWRRIDWSRGFEFLDKELRKIAREAQTGYRVVDLLVKVWLTNGQEEWILIHIEIQAQPEAEFPERMFVYSNRAFDHFHRRVASFAVLADDRPDWRPSEFLQETLGSSHRFRFETAKLLDWEANWEALEQSANPFAVVVMAHLRMLRTKGDANARCTWKTRLIKGMYERGYARDDIEKLFRIIDWLMALPKELDLAFWDDIKHYEKEKKMPFVTTPERIGFERGLEKGLEKGLVKGKLLGLIEARLEMKFGFRGKRLMPAIERLTDLARLKAVQKGIARAKTPEELRKLWE